MKNFGFLPIFSFLLRSSRRIVVLAILSSLISGISSAGLIALIHMALKNSFGSTLYLRFVGLAILSVLTTLSSALLLMRLSQGAILDLRMKLSKRILEAPLRHLEELGIHRLLAALTEDVMIIATSLPGVPVFLTHVAVLTGCLAYLGWLSWKLLLILLCFMMVGVLSYLAWVERAQKSFVLAREEQDNLYNHLRAITHGIKELKLNQERHESFLDQDLLSSAASYKYHSVTGFSRYILADNWGQLIFFTLIGFLLFVSPKAMNLSAGVLSGYILTMLYSMVSLDAILSWIPLFGRAGVSLRKIEKLGLSLGSFPIENASTPFPPYPSEKKVLELEGITHTYHREKEDSIFTLGPINLSFCEGELAFIVGGNGSGKTTMAKLLTGLYVPEKGVIRLGGQEIADHNRLWYRQHFSAIFSDFYLFERIIDHSNSRLTPEIQNYLTELQLHHKVRVKDGRFSTTELSQGQRKRLALLAAYLEDRSFYIFDEWAADQDPLFKEIFYNQILKKLKGRGKTVIVITHDDHFFHLADRLVKLNEGNIESDSNQSIVAKSDHGVQS